MLLQCIDLGRRARGGAGSDAQYEAFRLLGSALHTLEDFTAHSNYCELALHKLGYNQVFCHVGSSVHVRAPDGSMVPPLVTGTFGGSDFIHSLLGEATDHISSASVSDLDKEIEKAKNKPADRGIDGIRDMLFQLPGGEGNNLSRDMDDINNMRAAGTSDPMNMSPQELHAVLWKILKFRDDVSKAITNTIERIPGLGSLIEKIGDSVSTFVFVTIEPYIKPILQQATGVLQQGSAQVVNSQDQFRVFNDPNFYHPTHSSKSRSLADHSVYSLILHLNSSCQGPLQHDSQRARWSDRPSCGSTCCARCREGMGRPVHQCAADGRAVPGCDASSFIPERQPNSARNV